MALTKYELVNTNGLKGLNYKGDNIAFDKITDDLADELVGKTHVLKARSPKAAAKALAAAEEAPK
ncbi:hypothetical protein [Hymenobacter convexus]|uniref:hypothetical protein n=1 Tax=Hymenobacter sp. CA1UV-4 TaxID=3063782 RepID=UPI002712DA23|nr:hypothetical protein [Hymenobacter sp. CA1UV-4]MDO7851569.1 hypothetical protein [Hymenobacter sp. CA1UV-4]